MKYEQINYLKNPTKIQENELQLLEKTGAYGVDKFKQLIIF